MKPSINAQENSSPEIRAFIYQQLADLEGLLPQGSNVSIIVEDPSVIKIPLDLKMAKRAKSKKKKVIIQLETTEGNLLVESEHLDIYKAIQAAKENLRNQLSALQSFLNLEDRDKQINDIIDHTYLH